MNVYLISRLLPFLLRRSTVLHVFGLPRFGVGPCWPSGGGSEAQAFRPLPAFWLVADGRDHSACPVAPGSVRRGRLCPPGLAARGASAIAIVLLEVRMRRSRSLGAAGHSRRRAAALA